MRHTQLLRIPDVAEELSVSRSFVYRLMDRGDLAFVKIGKSRRIPVSAIEDLIRKNLVASN